MIGAERLRNMHCFGGEWTGVDISENQIEKAREMSEGLDIKYFVSSAEDMDFADNSFDVITACQCFWYFDHKKTAPLFARILKKGGKLLFLCMEWLPFEDEIAMASEQLVLKYNPSWSGAGDMMHAIEIPDSYKEYFDFSYREEYRIGVPFTRESWNGRMKACRGIGASLMPDKISEWENEHIELLNKIAPESFNIAHYAAIAELIRK